MPVRKFRSPSDMSATVGVPEDDPRLFGIVSGVLQWATSMVQPSFPPGVYKHRTLASLNAQSEQWEHDRIQRRLSEGKG